MAGYYSLGIGNGGKAGAPNLTLEIGSNNIKIRGKPYLAGIDIAVINHGDDKIPSKIIDAPCPHTDYTSLGRKPEGFEAGLLGKFGKGLFNSDVYISLLGGITRVHEIHVTQSNINPNKYYEQSSESKIEGVFGLGIGYFPELFDWKAKLNIQIDYDNRRGMTGYLGWGW